MQTTQKLLLPLIIGSTALLTACHHHDNRRSVPQRPIPGYNHQSPGYRNKNHPQRHRYNNLKDYNNDTLTPYESMW